MSEFAHSFATVRRLSNDDMAANVETRMNMRRLGTLAQTGSRFGKDDGDVLCESTACTKAIEDDAPSKITGNNGGT